MIYSDQKTNEPEIEDRKAGVKLSLRQSKSGDLKRQSIRSRGSSIRNKSKEDSKGDQLSPLK